MKVKELTIVIGAGGSAPYGFPTGKELKLLAIEALSRRNGAYRAVMRVAGAFKFQAGDVTKFCTMLVEDDLNDSIDAFVQSQAGKSGFAVISSIAKAITAVLIAERESIAMLIDEDWYTVLLKKMVSGNNTMDTFRQNKVNIITFNFDRSFEEYFMLKLAQQFGVSEFQIGSYLASNFQVIHMQGSLGPLWARSTASRPYSADLDTGDLVQAAKSIKFITDDTTTPEQETLIDEARAIIARSDIVDFIGVGFHALNMQLLGMGGGNVLASLQDNKYFGTVYDLDPIEIREIEVRYKLNQGGNNQRPGVTQSIHPSFDAKQIFKYIPTDWFI